MNYNGFMNYRACKEFVVKFEIVIIVSMNCWNRLQNYALHQALKGQGCVVTISHRNKKVYLRKCGFEATCPEGYVDKDCNITSGWFLYRHLWNSNLVR